MNATCPACDELAQSGDRYCAACGADLSVVRNSTQPRAAATPDHVALLADDVYPLPLPEIHHHEPWFGRRVARRLGITGVAMIAGLAALAYAAGPLIDRGDHLSVSGQAEVVLEPRILAGGGDAVGNLPVVAKRIASVPVTTPSTARVTSSLPQHANVAATAVPQLVRNATITAAVARQIPAVIPPVTLPAGDGTGGAMAISQVPDEEHGLRLERLP